MQGTLVVAICALVVATSGLGLSIYNTVEARRRARARGAAVALDDWRATVEDLEALAESVGHGGGRTWSRAVYERAADVPTRLERLQQRVADAELESIGAQLLEQARALDSALDARRRYSGEPEATNTAAAALAAAGSTTAACRRTFQRLGELERQAAG
ncbi:MAG: hypothetical protein F2825_11245 [Actinobacteria bacterium]|uniref:Unannotated protein n=1 Tax=freshwater metagenome TaxID=449393 RepID=A0A6J7ITH6_9ZZZZ|nr:hypothetical protein [Actinomycetota bacterium]